MAEQPEWDHYDDLQALVRYLEVQARQGILPACATEGHCEECPLGTECPAAYDSDFMSLLRYYRSLYSASERLRERRINAVVQVLQRHKLPMHWELVAQIVEDQEPKLFPSHWSVRSVLTRNPDQFSEDSSGSYFLEPVYDL